MKSKFSSLCKNFARKNIDRLVAALMIHRRAGSSMVHFGYWYWSGSSVGMAQVPLNRTWYVRSSPLQNIEKTFILSRTDRDLLQKPGYDLQVWCILLNDMVMFRMHWPQYADLRVNGVAVRVTNRPGPQLLGANGRDDGPGSIMINKEASTGKEDSKRREKEASRRRYMHRDTCSTQMQMESGTVSTIKIDDDVGIFLASPYVSKIFQSVDGKKMQGHGSSPKPQRVKTDIPKLFETNLGHIDLDEYHARINVLDHFAMAQRIYDNGLPQ
ncbi:hypothetical protein KI387_005900, partial [Taxus chinensis]